MGRVADLPEIPSTGRFPIHKHPPRTSAQQINRRSDEFMNAIQYDEWNQPRLSDTKETLATDRYHMGRVADLPEIPSTGIFSYTGELIQNRSLGGKAAMPSVRPYLTESRFAKAFPAQFFKLILYVSNDHG